jgi:hypothetical protein
MSSFKEALLVLPEADLVLMAESLLGNELFSIVVDAETNPLVLKHQSHTALDELSKRPYVQALPEASKVKDPRAG